MERDLQTLVTELATLATQKHCKIATAESCTGGGIAFMMTATSGSSEWFERGFVTYSNEAKQELLGVSADTLVQFGAVSEQTALEMAKGALAHSLADLSISVTGIAGPTGGSDEKPVGTVWFGLAQKGQKTQTFCQHFAGDRNQVRELAIHFALQQLKSALS